MNLTNNLNICGVPLSGREYKLVKFSLYQLKMRSLNTSWTQTQMEGDIAVTFKIYQSCIEIYGSDKKSMREG